MVRKRFSDHLVVVSHRDRIKSIPQRTTRRPRLDNFRTIDSKTLARALEISDS